MRVPALIVLIVALFGCPPPPAPKLPLGGQIDCRTDPAACERKLLAMAEAGGSADEDHKPSAGQLLAALDAAHGDGTLVPLFEGLQAARPKVPLLRVGGARLCDACEK